MADNKSVFCDTGFIIRLLDKTNELHNNAVGYFKYFLENDFIIRLSTIAVAEYCVKGSIDQLPLRNILLCPFNATHAVKTGECAKVLFEEKAKGVLKVDARIMIQNDVKLLAQTECESAEYFITSDTNSYRMYDILKKQNLLSFNFIDLNTPYSSTFGILDFKSE